MSSPGRPPPELGPRPEAPPSVGPEAGRAAPPTGTAAPPRAGEGRARAFRQAETERRSARRERYADALLVVVLILGAYAIVVTPPNSLLTGGGGPGLPGAPVLVNFGTVSVSAIACEAGGTAYAERIPWANSSRPVSTSEIDLEVYAIFDGDNLGRGNPTAVVTPTNVCAGSPPDPTALWYVVLQEPNGTNLVTYTVANSWTSVAPGSAAVTVENGSALVLVSSSSLAGSGRGLKVIGFAGETQIEGAVVL